MHICMLKTAFAKRILHPSLADWKQTNRKVTHWLLEFKREGEKEDEEHCCCLGHGVPKKSQIRQVQNGLSASHTNPTWPKKTTYRLIVMKSKLQFDSPISRAVARAESHTNRDVVEDCLCITEVGGFFFFPTVSQIHKPHSLHDVTFV